jgi:hypothetical protein
MPELGEDRPPESEVCTPQVSYNKMPLSWRMKAKAAGRFNGHSS